MKASIFGILAVSATLFCACAGSGSMSARDRELIHAADNGDVDRMVVLIKKGANINAQNSAGWTPYLAASTKGHFAAMKVLREKGCKTDPGF